MSKQTEDITAIKQLAEDWRVGWLTRDPETLLALLSDEPVLIIQRFSCLQLNCLGKEKS